LVAVPKKTLLKPVEKPIAAPVVPEVSTLFVYDNERDDSLFSTPACVELVLDRIDQITRNAFRITTFYNNIGVGIGISFLNIDWNST